MNTVVVIFLMVFTGQLARSKDQCETCNPSSCAPPGNCLAGRVEDSCDCCYVCGKKEGERCDHEDVVTSQEFGRCGDKLQCRVRTDLDPNDQPEAICFCVQRDPLCASDGVTYENVCQLTEARYMQRNGLKAVYMGPCRKPPKISTPPVDVRNRTGKNVALMCEVIGWPTPEIEWSRDGTIGTLPGSQSHISVQSTSGPGQGEITSWLLFSSLQANDEAAYRCTAENEMGSTTAHAHVEVIDD